MNQSTESMFQWMLHDLESRIYRVVSMKFKITNDLIHSIILVSYMNPYCQLHKQLPSIIFSPGCFFNHLQRQKITQPEVKLPEDLGSILMISWIITSAR